MPVSHPLIVDAHASINYFQPREKLSLLDLVRNPSFLALIVPIAMVWLLPKLSEGMMGIGCLFGNYMTLFQNE
jgi:hypothetical protein